MGKIRFDGSEKAISDYDYHLNPHRKHVFSSLQALMQFLDLILPVSGSAFPTISGPSPHHSWAAICTPGKRPPPLGSFPRAVMIVGEFPLDKLNGVQ